MLRGRLSGASALGGALSASDGLDGSLTVGGGTGYPVYDGETEWVPSESEQTIDTHGKALLDDIIVDAIPSNYVGSAVDRRDSDDLAASGATVTAPAGYYAEPASKAVASGSITMRKPTMDEAVGEVRSRADLTTGYVTGGSYGGSALILDKQAGTTITPTESEQVAVAQYRWTTGAVKVAAIPSQYIVPTGTYTVSASGTHDVTAHASASVASATPTNSSDSEYITSSGSRKWRYRPKTIVPTAGWADQHSASNPINGFWVTYDAIPTGTTVTPTASAQTIGGADTMMEGAVTVAAIPPEYIVPSGTKSITASGTHDVTDYASASVAAGSATMPASASGNGTIVGALNNTMNVQGTITATPQVSAGYVSAGTSGSTTVSLQTSVTTLNSATWTPTTSDQTIPAGRYTIGTQTIKGDANLLAENIADGVSLFGITGTCPTFDALSWLGQEAELIATFAKESTLLSSTSYASWTPSTTAKTIKSGASLTAVAIDLEQYDYLLRWQFYCEPVYNGSETNTARMVKTAQEIYQAIIRRPNSLANIGTLTEAGNACQTINTPSLMEYWNNSGSHTYTWSASYGIYAAATAATFASSTALQTNLTPKRPSISARCSTTYFSTGNAGKVTQASTYLYTQGWLYRIKKGKSLGYNQYHNVCSLFDNGI